MYTKDKVENDSRFQKEVRMMELKGSKTEKNLMAAFAGESAGS